MYIKLSHYTDVNYKNILVQYWPNLQWLDFIAEKQRFDYILVISKTKVVKPAAVVVKPYSIQLLFYFTFETVSSILILSIILQHISIF